MDTKKPEEYVAPVVKVVEVIVEKGFAITGIIINDRYGPQAEKHVMDDVESW
jgi:hypothetical protein